MFAAGRDHFPSERDGVGPRHSLSPAAVQAGGCVHRQTKRTVREEHFEETVVETSSRIIDTEPIASRVLRVVFAVILLLATLMAVGFAIVGLIVMKSVAFLVAGGLMAFLCGLTTLTLFTYQH